MRDGKLIFKSRIKINPNKILGIGLGVVKREWHGMWFYYFVSMDVVLSSTLNNRKAMKDIIFAPTPFKWIIKQRRKNEKTKS